MALTKLDLVQALKQQRKEIDLALKQQKKEIVSELSEFLEKYVLGPIFGLKKDVSVLKNDMREVKHEVEQINRRIDTIYDRDDRQDEKISQLEHLSLVT